MLSHRSGVWTEVDIQGKLCGILSTLGFMDFVNGEFAAVEILKHIQGGALNLRSSFVTKV